MPRLPADARLYVHAMGKAVRVTAVFPNAADANAYMARNPGEGVIAETAGLVLIADVKDPV